MERYTPVTVRQQPHKGLVMPFNDVPIPTTIHPRPVPKPLEEPKPPVVRPVPRPIPKSHVEEEVKLETTPTPVVPDDTGVKDMKDCVVEAINYTAYGPT